MAFYVGLGIKRLHDLDKSGWWFFIKFYSLYRTFIFLNLMVLPGTKGTNRLGEDREKEPLNKEE